jgi:hypothetical protein
VGKQINFYLDDDTEQKFIEFILTSSDATMLLDGKPIDLDTLYTPFSERRWYQIHIYKSHFGKLIIDELPMGRLEVNSLYSPVIEYSRTAINFDKKQILRGRIWVEMKYWNENAVLVEKNRDLEKWYGTLNRWIKKNVVKVEEIINGFKYVDYVSPTLLKLKDEGFKFM